MNGSSEKSGVAMGVGAVVAGLLASVCCLGPAVLGLAGLGALGAAGVLGASRPSLLGLTFLLLAGGFYFAYRKRDVVCEDGSCRREGAGSSVRAALWGLTILALGAAFYPQFKAALRRDACCVAPASSSNSGAPAAPVR